MISKEVDTLMQTFYETHYIHGVHAGLATVRPPIALTPIDNPSTVN